MGSIHSCTKHVSKSCANVSDLDDVGENHGNSSSVDRVSKAKRTSSSSSWSLIRSFSRSTTKKNGSGNKTKNKGSKAGSIPARHQSCRDVLITAGQCELCGKRHLLGNLLDQQNKLCCHDAKEHSGMCHDDEARSKLPKSISPCPNKSDGCGSPVRGTTGSVDVRQPYASNSSFPAQKSNESRPQRCDGGRGGSDSRNVKRRSDRKDYKKKDESKTKQTISGGSIQVESGDDESNQIGMPESVVDLPSGIRHGRECLEGPNSCSCLLQNMPPEIMDRKITSTFDIENYDTATRDKNVAYILGNNPEEDLNPEGIGGYAFTDHFILRSCAPTVDLVCLDESLNIYACDLGLSVDECNSIIHASEKCARIAGRYSAYTYAKQTLGCRDYDDLALECVVPTHVACQTIRKILGLPPKEASRVNNNKTSGGGTTSTTTIAGHKTDKIQSSSDCVVGDNTTKTLSSTPQSTTDTTSVLTSPSSGSTSIGKPSNNDDNYNTDRTTRAPQQESAPVRAVSDLRPSIMVLDEREPHVVKYDTVDKTRQRLEMHTDKSEWTFLIALSEYGKDYEGGGTFFEDSRTTYHLRRGTCLIFPGRLKHCGRKISKGSRFLLVGFLVEKKQESVPEEGPVQQVPPSPLASTQTTGATDVLLEPSSFCDDECDLLSDEESKCCQ